MIHGKRFFLWRNKSVFELLEALESEEKDGQEAYFSRKYSLVPPKKNVGLNIKKNIIFSFNKFILYMNLFKRQTLT